MTSQTAPDVECSHEAECLTTEECHLRRRADGEPTARAITVPGLVDLLPPVTKITRLPANGQTTIHVTPPRPCGLGDCIAELHVTIGHDSMRLHLGPEQRRGLIEALGGEIR